MELPQSEDPTKRRKVCATARGFFPPPKVYLASSTISPQPREIAVSRFGLGSMVWRARY